MATAALYNLTTGFISQTISPPLTNAEQIAGLEASGIGMVIIPDGCSGSNGMIDLSTKTFKSFAPKIPVPSFNSQLAAALIRNNVITADDLHPITIAEINDELSVTHLDQV